MSTLNLFEGPFVNKLISQTWQDTSAPFALYSTIKDKDVWKKKKTWEKLHHLHWSACDCRLCSITPNIRPIDMTFLRLPCLNKKSNFRHLLSIKLVWYWRNFVGQLVMSRHVECCLLLWLRFGGSVGRHCVGSWYVQRKILRRLHHNCFSQLHRKLLLKGLII